MNKNLFTLIIIALSGLIFGDQVLAGTFNQRQVRQQQRIRNGITNHQLTRLEARRLRHEQHQIQRQKKSYLRGGDLTYDQQRRLNGLQDRADRQITRLKESNRNRNPYLQPYRQNTEPFRIHKRPFHRFVQPFHRYRR